MREWSAKIERPGKEWTDGKLVIQPIEVTQGWRNWTKYRFFLPGQEQTEPIFMNQLFGNDQGPASESRHWSLEELDTILQDWLRDIPCHMGRDLSIVESIRVLLRGSIPGGNNFSVNSSRMRYNILLALPDLLALYIQKQAPIEGGSVDELGQALSNLSF